MYEFIPVIFLKKVITKKIIRWFRKPMPEAPEGGGVASRTLATKDISINMYIKKSGKFPSRFYPAYRAGTYQAQIPLNSDLSAFEMRRVNVGTLLPSGTDASSHNTHTQVL
jgi:hypothetical protein